MDPQSTPQAAPATAAPSPAKLQLVGQYMVNASIIGAKPAILEWTADDKIRLFIISDDGKTVAETLLDVPVGQVESAKAYIGYLYLWVGGKKYRFYVTDQTTAGIALGGVAGLGYAYAKQQSSGIPQWLQALKEAGVKTSTFGFKQTFLIAGAVVVVIVIIAVVFALLES